MINVPTDLAVVVRSLSDKIVEELIFRENDVDDIR